MYPNTQGYCYYFMYIYMHVIHNTVAPKEISLFMYQLDSLYSRNKSQQYNSKFICTAYLQCPAYTEHQIL